MQLIGKESKIKYNALAVKFADENSGNDVHMVGVHLADRRTNTTRTGWFRYAQFKNPDIIACLSYQEKDLIGIRLKSGKPFTVYLSEDVPEIVSSFSGKDSYDCSNADIVGFEVD